MRWIIKKRKFSVNGGNFTTLFIGNIVYSISQWGMLIVIARLGNPSFVGQYSFGLAVTAPVILFLNLQLRNYQATDTSSEYEFHQYLKLRIITMFSAYLIIMFIALFDYHNLDLLLVILFVGLAKVIESISDIYFGLFQKHEQMKYISKSMIIKGTVSLSALTITMLLTDSIVLGSLSIALTWFIILIFYDLKNGMKLLNSKEMKTRSNFILRKLDLKIIKNIAWITLPLGLVSTLDSLNSNIPRYFLQNIGGEETLGYYAAISYFMIAGGTVVNAMLQASSPKLATYYRLDINKFKKMLVGLIGLSAIIGCLGIIVALIFGKQILSLMYGSDYTLHNNVLICIMIASAIWFIASCLSIALTASRFIKVQVPIYTISCIFVFLTSLYLIPHYNLLGAALSVCAGMFMRAALTLISVVFSVRKQTKLEITSVLNDR